MEFKKGDRVKIKLPGNIYYGKKAVVHEVGNFSCGVVVVARKAKGVMLIIHLEHLELVPKKIKKPTVCEGGFAPKSSFEAKADFEQLKEVFFQLLKEAGIKVVPSGGFVPKSGFEKAFEKKLQKDYDQLKDTFDLLAIKYADILLAKAPEDSDGLTLEQIVDNWRNKAGLI